MLFYLASGRAGWPLNTLVEITEPSGEILGAPAEKW
jgi:hypothetical protein